MTPRAWKVALSANSTQSGFASRVPTTSNTIDSEQQSSAPNAASFRNEGDTVEVAPYGAGADNSTLSLRVIGWRRAGPVVNSFIQWIPTVVADLSCTLSAAVGIAGRTPTSTDRFADTITVTTGVAVVPSVTADTVGTAFVAVDGYEYIEFITSVGTATNANCLFVSYGELGV